MDLPSSGWYPDPYGTPRLLRWWDGSAWTQHTHPDISPVGAEASGAPAAGLQVAAHAAGGQATALQATSVQATSVQATSVQATAVQQSVGLAGSGRLTGGQPSTEWLRQTKPPTGRMTQPQPALPDTLAPTALQPGMRPSGQQPGIQPTVVQPGYPQPGSSTGLAGLAGGADAAGTQVMYQAGQPWQAPADQWQGAAGLGGLGLGAGGPGGPVPGNRYGYLEAQRRRRTRVIGGVTAGTAVAVAAIVVIALNLGGSSGPATADQSHVTTPPAAPASTTPAASTTPSPTASASPTATAGGSLLSDGQSGISYNQLAAPWQGAGCPSSLNNGAFTWTDGEYAVAGQVNNGATTWYGEACSGPLPQQYGYTGAAQLQTIAENLAGTFADAYYNILQHNTTPEQDQAVQVNGHSGWEVTYDISYTNAAAQGVTWADEQAAVVVVDTGTGGEPAVFFTSIPQSLNEGNIPALVSSLQLTSASAGLGRTPANTTSTNAFGATNP